MKLQFNSAHLIAVLVISICGSRLADSQETRSDNTQTCEKLCALPDVAWATIPWEMDLLKAQRMAVEQSKPIFIWSMDGHPLACT